MRLNIGIALACLAGIVALGIGLSGCVSGAWEPINPKTALGTAMRIKASDTRDPKKAYRAASIGDSLIGEGQSEAARNNQNVVVNQPQLPLVETYPVQQPQYNPPQQTQQPQYNNNRGRDLPDGVTMQNDVVMITCNYWDDLNKDGGMDSLDECVGKKSKFTIGEKVTYFITPLFLKKGDKTKIIMKNQNGEIIRSDELVSEVENKMQAIYVTYKPGELPEGINRIAWYVNDKNVGFRDTEITK
ncbi:MAG: hypothetical protein V1701_09490 [Planctomycetota bacterium]